MTYCYRKDSGEVVEVVMTVAEMHDRQRADRTIILDDGEVGKRDYAAEYCGREPRNNSLWPRESDAMGVNPGQAGSAYADSVKRGVPTEFDRETGCAKFRTKRHEREYCEAVGFHQNNAGYSDPVPR